MLGSSNSKCVRALVLVRGCVSSCVTLQRSASMPAGCICLCMAAWQGRFITACMRVFRRFCVAVKCAFTARSTLACVHARVCAQQRMQQACDTRTCMDTSMIGPLCTTDTIPQAHPAVSLVLLLRPARRGLAAPSPLACPWLLAWWSSQGGALCGV